MAGRFLRLSWFKCAAINCMAQHRKAGHGNARQRMELKRQGSTQPLHRGGWLMLRHQGILMKRSARHRSPRQGISARYQARQLKAFRSKGNTYHLGDRVVTDAGRYWSIAQQRSAQHGKALYCKATHRKGNTQHLGDRVLIDAKASPHRTESIRIERKGGAMNLRARQRQHLAHSMSGLVDAKASP